MRKMKDSQIEWVGNIPETWTTELGKHFMSRLDRPVKDDDSVITCFRDGQVTLRSNRREDGFTLAFQEIGYQGIEPGDLVVHGMDGFAGAIGISDSRGKATPVLNVLDTKQNKKYMMYALRNMAYTDVFLALSTGIRIRSCDTSWKKLRALNYALPPLDEQNKIADYLEVKEKQIEDLISKVEAQIVKLKQYKQSVITEVIVNGLDPNSPMKDSGLDWLGQIPKDTDVIGITYILDKNHPYPLGDGDHGLIGPDDYISEGIPYIRVQNLGWGTDLLTDNIVYISEERNNAIKNSTLRPNDILFAKTGATIGKTGIVPSNMPIANTTSHIGKITVSPEYDPKYIFYVLTSFIGYRQFWAIACQKTTRPELAISEMKTIKVLVPKSRETQREIVEYLDGKCKGIDQLITIKEAKVDRLRQLKKTLIYEYVTGKKEVV